MRPGPTPGGPARAAAAPPPAQATQPPTARPSPAPAQGAQPPTGAPPSPAPGQAPADGPAGAAPGRGALAQAAGQPGSPPSGPGRPPAHLADVEPAERAAWVESLGLPRLRARQAARHYFARLDRTASDMTDLPAAGRDSLVKALLPQLATAAARRSTDGGRTIKTLYRLFDATPVETVLMAYPGRATVCVSAQAGCGMACPFCATGKLGLKRNLSAAEVLEQVRLAAVEVRDGVFGPGGPNRLSNVVFMGMGEPLANYKALVRALRGISAAPPDGFGLSARHITVSTCGLIGGIDRLAGEGLPVRLALSLHAPDDEARNRLVPVNRRYGVRQTIAAAHRYHQATGRRVSIEYALIREINDQPWRAAQLARRLCQYGTGWVHVNPIPLNPVEGSIWTASRPEAQERFLRILEGSGLRVTLRDTRGREIDGACGQLAAREVLN